MRHFWYGTAAGCAFVVVSLIARAADSVPTLPELAQDRLVLLLPGPLFSLLLDRLLYLGKPLLFAALLLAEVAAGGLAGLAIGRWGRPAAAAAALWLLTGFVLLPLVDRGVFAGSAEVALVLLLGLAAYALTYTLFAGLPLSLAALFGPAQETRQAEAETPEARAAAQIDRRRLLAGGTLGLATVLLTRRAIGRLPELPPRGGGGSALAAGGGDASAGGADEAFSGLPPPVTPVDRFYIVSKNLLDPVSNGKSWRLHVGGMVERPLTLGYGEITALPAVTQDRTLECISNETGGDLISNGVWTAARLADVLQRAGVQPGAAAITFSSADKYTSALPLAQAQDPSTLLAYQLDGAPLPHKHGYPVRVLAAGLYGMKNPKWLTRIDLVAAEQPGFWQQQGWDEQGIIQTMAQINTPVDGAKLAAGTVQLAGIAFAGARGIARVEVSSDGGVSWADARLLPSLGPNTWTFWQNAWQPAGSGAFTLSVRATDGSGTEQPARRTDPFPAGATGYHQIRVRVGG
ncbi:MAG TPA: molybdopterin-dependent oxidoreductase [Dehalococcoidia bacterium]|nr:molybdopterin-dependent oxidoreductase [Dehalococcoidia bacterium]